MKVIKLTSSFQLIKNPKTFFIDSIKNYNYKKRLKCTLNNNQIHTPIFCLKINHWKRNFFETIFKDNNLIYLPFNLDERSFYKFWSKIILTKSNNQILIWGLNYPVFLKTFIKKHNIQTTFVEDGFIRSIDLGSNHSLPLSLNFDSKTPYFDSTEESDLESILNNFDSKRNNDLIYRSKLFKEKLLKNEISKYNNTKKIDLNKIYGEKTKKRILVIGQVEDDASIKYGCNKTFTNNDLVKLAYEENPEAQIIYKPHPDVLFKKREKLSNPDKVKDIALVIETPFPIAQSFETIDHVYTITSQAGFEALLRNIPVTTIGCPFYSGWGLTDDRQKNSRRKRKLSLDELFAGAYLIYPKYYSPYTKKEITVDEAIELLVQMRNEK